VEKPGYLDTVIVASGPEPERYEEEPCPRSDPVTAKNQDVGLGV